MVAVAADLFLGMTALNGAGDIYDGSPCGQKANRTVVNPAQVSAGSK
jgi:hypothetical protein